MNASQRIERFCEHLMSSLREWMSWEWLTPVVLVLRKYNWNNRITYLPAHKMVSLVHSIIYQIQGPFSSSASRKAQVSPIPSTDPDSQDLKGQYIRPPPSHRTNHLQSLTHLLLTKEVLLPSPVMHSSLTVAMIFESTSHLLFIMIHFRLTKAIPVLNSFMQSSFIWTSTFQSTRHMPAIITNWQLTKEMLVLGFNIHSSLTQGMLFPRTNDWPRIIPNSLPTKQVLELNTIMQSLGARIMVF
jgi:hypothetical protein